MFPEKPDLVLPYTVLPYTDFQEVVMTAFHGRSRTCPGAGRLRRVCAHARCSRAGAAHLRVCRWHRGPTSPVDEDDPRGCANRLVETADRRVDRVLPMTTVSQQPQQNKRRRREDGKPNRRTTSPSLHSRWLHTYSRHEMTDRLFRGERAALRNLLRQPLLDLRFHPPHRSRAGTELDRGGKSAGCNAKINRRAREAGTGLDQRKSNERLHRSTPSYGGLLRPTMQI